MMGTVPDRPLVDAALLTFQAGTKAHLHARRILHILLVMKEERHKGEGWCGGGRESGMSSILPRSGWWDEKRQETNTALTGR